MTDNTSSNSSSKLTLFNIATIITVLALHGGIASALINMEPVAMPIIEPEPAPPIEIELVTIVDKTTEPVEIESTLEPTAPEPTAPESTAPESTAPEPNVPESNVPEPPEFKPTTTQPTTTQPTTTQPTTIQPTTIQPTMPVLTTNTEIVGQWEVPESSTTTGQSTISESSAPPAPPTPPAPSTPPTPPAPPESPAPGPQYYSSGQASWVYKPTPSFSERINRGLRPGDTLSVVITITVDKQGNISNAQVSSPSGNAMYDREALQAMSQARFAPHTVNGVPVVGIVKVPVNYTKP